MRELDYAAAGPVPELSDSEFQKISTLAKDKFGIVLGRGKEKLVSARLTRKLQELRLKSFLDYYNFVLRDSSGKALCEMMDALATNFTSFLREPSHFKFLREVVLPEFASRGTIRIWTAACSTGEEPYTIGFSALEELGATGGMKIQISASDISTHALANAKRAIYKAEKLSGMDPALVKKYFAKGEGEWAGWFKVRPNVTSLVRFSRVNLMEPVPTQQLFHAIFCRNVMIYFDKTTQAAVVNRLAGSLEPGGYLFIGHAEGLAGIDHPLQYVQPAVYQKPGRADFRKAGARFS